MSDQFALALAGRPGIGRAARGGQDDDDRTPFAFATAGEILFGRGVAAGIGRRVAAFGTRALLVHGSRAAAADWLDADLAVAGVRAARFACAGEPDIALVERGVAAARQAGADVIVALGGGSVIDAAKAIAALAPGGRPILDHLEVVGRTLPLERPPLPVVALPTTAGTGAEGTRNAVIGVPQAERKVSLRDVRMLPRLAVVDPALTDRCPRAVTLASGLDAVTQVIEAYVSTRANRVTDALSRGAIATGLTALIRLMDREDAAARDDMAWTSLCGGLALANGGLGAVHGLAGPIGGMAPAPHGAVCGVLLPHVLAANLARAGGEAARRLAETRGLIGEAFGVDADAALGTLADWSRRCGLPGLAQMGLGGERHAAVAAAALSSSSMKGNPVALQESTLMAILAAAA